MSSRRPDKPPFSAWLSAERKRHGLKAEEVARRLRELGYPAEDSTYRTWEAGRRPADDTVAALERLFETPAPRMNEPGAGDPAGLMAAMTAALLAQATALTELGLALERSRREATEEREATNELLGHLSDQLDELRDRVGTQAASAGPGSGR